jgi:hypothetical protein
MNEVKCPHCGHVWSLKEQTLFKLKVKKLRRLRCSKCQKYFYAYLQKEKSDNNPVPLAVLSALDVGVEVWKKLPPERRQQIRKLVEKGSVALARHILKMSLLKRKP